jgi:hypothetical protein
MKRTLHWQGISYQVLKHKSSGLGDQFTLEHTADGKPVFLYLTPEIATKNPEVRPLFEAARALFEQKPTLGNNIRIDGDFYRPAD